MDITNLVEENEKLKTEIIELKEQLKKYTYGNTHKRYYEKNKEKVKEGGANYLKKLKEENPEKLKDFLPVIIRIFLIFLFFMKEFNLFFGI